MSSILPRPQFSDCDQWKWKCKREKEKVKEEKVKVRANAEIFSRICEIHQNVMQINKTKDFSIEFPFVRMKVILMQNNAWWWKRHVRYFCSVLIQNSRIPSFSRISRIATQIQNSRVPLCPGRTWYQYYALNITSLHLNIYILWNIVYSTFITYFLSLYSCWKYTWS